MSTDLYGVRILEVEPSARRVRMRVFVVYYDVGHESHQPVPSDRSFFVRVLCDKDALGDDIAHSNRFSERWIDRNAFRFIERFVELARRNEPVASYEGYHDFYYERDGAWQDEDELVQADYDVFVTNEAYTAALSPGDSWGTTAYPTRADGLDAEDYPHVPDFDDDHGSFTPFAEEEGEATVVDAARFSADGARLLLINNEGGLEVVATDDGRALASVAGDRSWNRAAGWTRDGRVAWAADGGFVALDVGTGQREPFAPFGGQASSTGDRFVDEGEASFHVRDGDGRSLFEGERRPDYRVHVAFDASGDACFAAHEDGPLHRIDLRSGDMRPLPVPGRISALASSPDGRYLLAATYDQGFVVVRAADGAVIRAWKPAGQRIPTAVAWSLDGRLAMTCSADSSGYDADLVLHRIGREIDAAARLPLGPPPRADRGIADLARLYVERTRRFEPGWASHLDDDLVDFHLTLARLGADLDLTPHMRQRESVVLARAHEAVVRAEAGDESRARLALADADARLGALEIAPWQATFVYAPLAAARHLLGDHAGAAADLDRAWAARGDEANFFQKRLPLARALVRMGRADDVTALIDEAAGHSYISLFQARFLVELIGLGEGALFERASEAWRADRDWSVRQDIERAKRHAAGQAHPDPEPVAEPGSLADLAARGRWQDAYALVHAAQSSQREPLFEQIADAARRRGDIDILLDALGRILCEDMNSPGLRALQAAFRWLAGPAFAEVHP